MFSRDAIIELAKAADTNPQAAARLKALGFQPGFAKDPGWYEAYARGRTAPAGAQPQGPDGGNPGFDQGRGEDQFGMGRLKNTNVDPVPGQAGHMQPRMQPGRPTAPMQSNGDDNPWRIGASEGMTYDKGTMELLLERAKAGDGEADYILRQVGYFDDNNQAKNGDVAGWAKARNLSEYDLEQDAVGQGPYRGRPGEGGPPDPYATQGGPDKAAVRGGQPLSGNPYQHTNAPDQAPAAGQVGADSDRSAPNPASGTVQQRTKRPDGTYITQSYAPPSGMGADGRGIGDPTQVDPNSPYQSGGRPQPGQPEQGSEGGDQPREQLDLKLPENPYLVDGTTRHRKPEDEDEDNPYRH